MNSLTLVTAEIERLKALPEEERRKDTTATDLLDRVFDGAWIFDYNEGAKPTLAECAARIILEMDELPRKCEECGGTGVIKKSGKEIPCFECQP